MSDSVRCQYRRTERAQSSSQRARFPEPPLDAREPRPTTGSTRASAAPGRKRSEEPPRNGGRARISEATAADRPPPIKPMSAHPLRRVSVLARLATLFVNATGLLAGSTWAAQSPPGVARSANRLDLVEVSVTELQAGLRAGRFTSEDLVRAYLDRIAAYDDGFPFLNGVLTVNPAAVESARERDADRARGR